MCVFWVQSKTHNGRFWDVILTDRWFTSDVWNKNVRPEIVDRLVEVEHVKLNERAEIRQRRRREGRALRERRTRVEYRWTISTQSQVEFTVKMVS